MRFSELFEAGETEALASSGNLRVGSRGEPVRALQTILRNKNHNPGTIDGIFGPNTERAVRSFQRAENIQVDGIVGPQTKRKLGVSSSSDVGNSNTPDATRVSADAPTGPGANQSSGWTTMEIGGTMYEVGNDYVRSGNSYATFSGNSARAYCQSHNWIMPTAAMCSAIARRARIIVMPTQNQYDPNGANYMGAGGNARLHTQQILRQTGGSFPNGLVAGHKKDVVQGDGSGTCLWGGAKSGGGFWQGGSCPHGGDYEDYSQGLRPIRLARGRTA